MAKAFICCEYDKKGNAIPETGCGQIDHVLFDGYSFGDRQLEGVMFRALLKDDEIAVDTVDNWSKSSYLRGLNRDYWLKQALDYAKQNDIAACPKCGNDVGAQPVEV